MDELSVIVAVLGGITALVSAITTLVRALRAPASTLDGD